ncbi:bifunctional aspartate kinase/homoserine dehydrogenase I [uncultured Muribaculum sp.]|uniref:bifunctional aspartate kinase/homoserine dehydrogenase I n=2 Tax=uncultured Muribaculum sp. TaxID=1918613 RepID=UPI0025B7497C|nr:bifunctional aspartate kinase/homoserine dehydrogenase I [uncultured Muribaculum sp.]
MKVLKFGGTSVGTVDSLRNVKAIVEGNTEPLIVVVSALGGITDQLINTARQAASADASHVESYSKIVERHHRVIEGIVPEVRRPEVLAVTDKLLEELGNIYRGVSLIKDLSDRTLDIIVSYGERISSVIVANIIDGAVHRDSLSFIRTTKQWDKHILDNDVTQCLIHSVFDDIEAPVVVVPGFISCDSNGNVTNLGRGGSDYTAAILAATLSADVLEIWTDVDGFMTADPRVINNALVIDRLSFTEAMELCNFGAKVIYPPTIYPVFHKNIPIVIKNTFNPDAPGTWISDEPAASEDKPIKGISSINDTCLITVKGLGMVGVIGINSRIFNALAHDGISVFMVSQAASENNTSFAVRNADATHALKVLREEFAPELSAGSLTEISSQPDLATVAIVGENMKHAVGTAGRLFNTLGRNGISVIACAQGASETNISFVIDSCNLRKALNVIHDSFFLSDTQVLNLFVVGTGKVGRKLLEQIHAQQDNLLNKKSLSLRLVGIANSRQCYFTRYGIDIDSWEEILSRSELPATPQNILDGVIKMNIFNSVFVDCTANEDIAKLYLPLLSNNINVVAANKIAASGAYDEYVALKRMARKKGVKFLFETNVGAGLPVINTINSLINSGDRILRIEAVLSGTLNYICNAVSGTIPLTQAIEMAMKEGYSEPDPRIDLSGKDVVRKIVILAREAEYKIEQADVVRNEFIPHKCFNGTVEDFFKTAGAFNADFEAKRRDAEGKGLKLRYVACLNEGHVSVGVQAVGQEHPFYNLAGSNNVVLITTERYNEYPMAIKGYGAGASVTAAGVFSDIISIANIR